MTYTLTLNLALNFLEAESQCDILIVMISVINYLVSVCSQTKRKASWRTKSVCTYCLTHMMEPSSWFTESMISLSSGKSSEDWGPFTPGTETQRHVLPDPQKDRPSSDGEEGLPRHMLTVDPKASDLWLVLFFPNPRTDDIRSKAQHRRSNFCRESIILWFQTPIFAHLIWFRSDFDC